MKNCAKGHQYRGDETARARKGWCPVCHGIAQRRYDQSEKGRKRQRVYNHSEKGAKRHDTYFQSPKGWRNRLDSRRAGALTRRKRRKEAKDPDGALQREES